MTPKEIILTALRGGRPDRVPAALVGGGTWSVHHYRTTFEAMAGDAALMTDMLTTVAGELGSDIVYAGSGYPNFPAAALGGKIIFRPVGTPDLEGPVAASEADLDGLDLSRIDRDPVLRTIGEAFRRTRRLIGDEFVVTVTAWAPFTLAARLIGEEVMMKSVFRRPAFVEKALALATAVLIRMYEPLVRERLLDVILLGDPTASGDLISRTQFERFSVPSLKIFTLWARSFGVHTIVHICGNTTDRIELFPLTGAACISLDQKTDIGRAKEVLAGGLCIAGNVDPVKVLLNGSEEETREACRSVMERAGNGGGFMLMPGCDIPPTVPFGNLKAFFRAAREFQGTQKEN